MARDEQPSIKEKTVIICPRCGKRTGTSVRDGDTTAYCRRCGIEIEVIIRVNENGSPKTQPQRGPSQNPDMKILILNN